MSRRVAILSLFALLFSACAPASVQTPEVLTTVDATPTATEVTITSEVTVTSTPESVLELRPQTVTCLHPEDVEAWCLGLEPKDPHGLWQRVIDALADGPANADYWADTLGKSNPTRVEIQTWLAEHDYFLPAASPKGVEFVWIVGNPGYPEFKTNKVITDAGGVSLANIRTVVISPDNWSEIKDWWRAQIDKQISSKPIVTSGKTAYSPAEVYGWIAVNNDETGLVELVFVGGSSYIPDPSRKLGFDRVMIGGEGADNTAVITAMLETLLRASTQFTEKDLDLRSPDDLTPDMSIISVIAGTARFPTDPRKINGEEIWFE
ncbi:MAG: hypothetical protein ACOYZ6_05700 [Chloroflexota bacterium]